mmetsp:Transcript_71447/g.220888  ORF Transcript_71447/g.220888 Transcript_71447/m.220888 type:complete len:149 (-) Transcript_71447:203-649(-)
MMRYNLIEQRLLGPRAANAVSVALPWVVSVLLYCGTGFTDLVNFAGTFTSSIVNLIVPSALFIASQQLRPPVLGSRASAGRVELLSANELMAVGGPSCSPSPGVVRDRSGLLRSARHRTAWLRVAWANVFVMTFLTVVSISDQLANRS